MMIFFSNDDQNDATMMIFTCSDIPKVLASGWGRPKDNATGISPVLREVKRKPTCAYFSLSGLYLFCE